MIDPSEFGLPVRDPETYMILAVMDLIKVVGTKALHTYGELSNEYLGMISLYAIRRAYKFYGKGSPYGSLIKQAYDAFDPDHMSDRSTIQKSVFPADLQIHRDRNCSLR